VRLNAAPSAGRAVPGSEGVRGREKDASSPGVRVNIISDFAVFAQALSVEHTNISNVLKSKCFNQYGKD